MVIAVIGMGLAFLMTGPTAAQLDSFQGIAGAHTVGVPDGGPGLPLLGWSTVAGDLRIPHFVGMHALQMIPLTALLLELVSARAPLLRTSATRLRIVWIVIGAYLGVLAILTGQALAGQSIVQPGIVVVTLVALLSAVAAVALLAVLLAARRPSHRSPRATDQFDKNLPARVLETPGRRTPNNSRNPKNLVDSVRPAPD